LRFPQGTSCAAMLSNLLRRMDAKMLEQVMFPIAASVLAGTLPWIKRHRSGRHVDRSFALAFPNGK
jgi:hypothetical protein